jgi:hypothetical protein
MRQYHTVGDAQRLGASVKALPHDNFGSFITNKSAARQLQPCGLKSRLLHLNVLKLNGVHFTTSRIAQHPYLQGQWMLDFGKN